MARRWVLFVDWRPLSAALALIPSLASPCLALGQAERDSSSQAASHQERPQPPDSDEDNLLGDEQDDLFGDEDDLLDEPKLADDDAARQPPVDVVHEQVFLADRFPPATACETCHPKQYREWSVSQHAYAQMSPVFNAMHGTILMLTNGTNGDFCIRCHSPVGMNLGEPEFMSNIDRHPTNTACWLSRYRAWVPPYLPYPPGGDISPAKRENPEILGFRPAGR